MIRTIELPLYDGRTLQTINCCVEVVEGYCNGDSWPSGLPLETTKVVMPSGSAYYTPLPAAEVWRIFSEAMAAAQAEMDRKKAALVAPRGMLVGRS